MAEGALGPVTAADALLCGALDDYELTFESGERMRGRFLVTRLDYSGDYNGEWNYTLSLESSGPVVTV